MSTPREIAPPHAALVLVCKKCLRKAGADEDALRAELKGALGKSARVVRTGCLDVCPKGRVCVVASPTQGRDRYLLVDPAAPAHQAVDAVVRALEDG